MNGNNLLFNKINVISYPIVFIITANFAVAGINDGLVAEYPFNGNANDETGNGYDGTVYNAVLTQDRHGNANSAYYFDGSGDYIHIGQQPNFPSWTNYSVSAWFLNDGGGDQGAGYGQKVISKNTWYTDFYITVAGGSSPNPNDRGNLIYNTYQGSGAAIVHQQDYRDNNWHHVVINKQGSNGELWVDGVLVGTRNDMKTVFNTVDILIGYSASGDFYQKKYWSGKLDDFRIYNRTLDEDEISFLHTGVMPIDIDIKPGSDPNCININSHGVIPVAILGSEDLDVTQINLSSLSFAGLTTRTRGNNTTQCVIVYSNADAYPDLLCHFEDNKGIWNPDSENEASLTGKLVDETPFSGTDSICLVP